MNIKNFIPVIILASSGLTATAQSNSTARSQQTAARHTTHNADSLSTPRDTGNGLLHWGDSILESQLDKGKINKKQYRRFHDHLYRYDQALLHGDSLLAEKYSKVTYDTLYIRRPAGRWTIKFRVNTSGSTIETKGVKDGARFNARVESDYRATVSAAVTYRGLTLGLAINPTKLAGKSKDNEFNITSYGNRFGFDMTLLTSKTYKGHVKMGGQKVSVDKGMVNQQALNINMYYAFNGRKFSIPAAFSQSYIQRRSAGSFLAGMSFDGQNTDIDAVNAINVGKVKIRIMELGIGAGYGYNFVTHRRWLFHISALPTFNIFVHSHVSNDNERVNLHYKFPSIIITGRSAAVYSWKNKFLGISMLFNYSGTGDDNRLYVRRSKFRIRTFYGFRL